MNEKLIVALDVDTLEEAVRLVDSLSGEVSIYKVGLAPFVEFGESLLEELERRGKKVFLDLKFHDIPNTVRRVTKAACRKNVFMINYHCLGGAGMLGEAAHVVKESLADERKRPLLLGVTVLTSMTEEDLKDVGISGGTGEAALKLARLAKRAGLDGVVASAKEVREIKKEIGKDFLVVTPGIRPLWSAKGDQKRIATPKGALEEGADYIVVGRPIIEAKDPREAARKIKEEMQT